MSNIPVYQYAEIPSSKFCLPIDRYEDYIKQEPETHGVKWVYKSCYPPEITGEKRRNFDCPWTVYYECHRAGSPRKRIDRVRDTSITKRPLQKASKKVGCKARLIVSCQPDEQLVYISYVGMHDNHTVGSLDDLRYLPLSLALKNEIELRLREGYDKRDIRISIQKYFSREITSSVHRDQLLHNDEIYNIYKKIQEQKYMLKKDIFESLDAWLNKLREDGFLTFKSSNFRMNYSFGFMSTWQRAVLLECSSFCLDATHNVTNIQNGILYTIVTTHPNTGTGCPVAFFFTKDHSSDPVMDFLLFVKGAGLVSPSKFTIDVSHTELNALNLVYPDVPVQWCLFHVGRAWNSKVKEYIKGSSTTESKALQKQAMRDLQQLVNQPNETNFYLEYLVFKEKYKQYTEFIQYFDKHYFDKGWHKHWCKAFQPNYYTNMETNNYVESWHNQLKTIYLKRKRNRRLDRLIFVLTQDVIPDYVRNVKRITYNIGRMGPQERERRKRMLLAEQIPEELLQEYVICDEVQEGRIYFDLFVKSFSDNEVKYHVLVNNNGEIYSCQCEYFQYRSEACKHMYLAYRYMPFLEVQQPDIVADDLNSNGNLETVSQTNTYSNTHDHEVNNVNNNEKLSQRNTLLKCLDEIQTLLNEDELLPSDKHELIQNFTNILVNDRVRRSTQRLPNNSNFTTQR